MTVTRDLNQMLHAMCTPEEWENIQHAAVEVAAKAEARRKRRNAQRRMQNQILREMCGTSARAAREDMGMGR